MLRKVCRDRRFGPLLISRAIHLRELSVRVSVCVAKSPFMLFELLAMNVAVARSPFPVTFLFTWVENFAELLYRCYT